MNNKNNNSFEVCQRFYFDAAHSLKREIETEGSRRIHGHTYQAEVAVRGALDTRTGMVMDIGLIRLEVAKVRELLDHHYLDEVPDLGIPTLENLCIYIEKTMRANGLTLSRVSVWRESLGDRCDMAVLP
jgi:6-pyruvoyltetrahydropterin/6-carboxytetrahydropterin synthase